VTFATWVAHETFGTKIYIPPYEKIINSLNTKALSIFLSE
jgi:hypothetical protein